PDPSCYVQDRDEVGPSALGRRKPSRPRLKASRRNHTEPSRSITVEAASALSQDPGVGSSTTDPGIISFSTTVENDEQGADSVMDVTLVNTDTSNAPVLVESFRWKALSDPWTAMYRGHEKRTYSRALVQDGSRNGPPMQNQERTSGIAAWSDTLEELHEAVSFVHDLHSGYQLSSGGLLEALVLVGPSSPGDKCVDDVLTVGLTFRFELKKTKTQPTRELTPADYPVDPIIDALRLNHKWGVPFALIADDNFGIIPSPLRAPFTILGWYHVAEVGESIHAYNNAMKRPVVESSCQVKFRPASTTPYTEEGQSATLDQQSPEMDVDESTSDLTPTEEQITLNTVNADPLPTADTEMEPAEERLVELATSFARIAHSSSPDERLVESMLAMSVGCSNATSQRSSMTPVAVEPKLSHSQEKPPKATSQGAPQSTDTSSDPLPALPEGTSLIAHKSSHPLPSQAEMFAAYANEMILIDEEGHEIPAKAPDSSAHGVPETISEPPSNPTLAKRRAPYRPGPVEVPLFLPSRKGPGSRTQSRSGSSQTTSLTYQHKPGSPRAERGNIRSRLMADFSDYTALRKPVREEFALSTVFDSTGAGIMKEAQADPHYPEEAPPTSIPGAVDEPYHPVQVPPRLPSRSPSPSPLPTPQPALPPAPSPRMISDEIPTIAIIPPEPDQPAPPPEPAPSTKKPRRNIPPPDLPSSRRSKDQERPKFEPPTPRELPDFPHLPPPPNAKRPISPGELGLSFERPELDAEEATQWDLIATKLDGFI
ncbi:hypothetical protein FRB90_008060, partial [Tulasnella sp. 427]